MTLKIATLFALGLTLVAHDALAEEPAAKPEPVTVERSSPGDRAALRAELRREAIAAHTELRQERAEGRAARPEGPARPEGSARPERSEAQQLRDQKQARRDEQRQSTRELRREGRDEQREANRSLIRRTQ
jgi:hypothetical protein